MVVDDIDEGSKSSDDLENEYEGIQNVKLRAGIMLETMRQ